MSISSALGIARTGLQVVSQRAEVVSTNVANASTPGYVRRSLLFGEKIVGGKSAGVMATGIGREADAHIKAQRRSLTTDLSQANVLASTWKAMSSRLGSTADGAGLFRTFTQFETALSNAVNSPESTAAASSLLNATKAVASELNNLSAFATNLRAEADREIAEGVTIVNTALKQVESINKQLAGIDRNTNQGAALYDERQRVLDTIAEYLPIQTVERDRGAIEILTTEGVYILAGTAREIEFQPSTVFTADQTHAGGQLSGISVGGISLTPGTASFGAVSSGLLGALFTLRDQDVPAFNAQLDMVAEDLITRLSDDAIDPTKTPGAEGLFVDPASAGTVGIAGRIAVNAAVDPAQGGDIWRLRDGLGAAGPGAPGDRTILSALHAAVTDVRFVNNNGIQGSFSSTSMVAQFASLTGQARIHHESVQTSTETQHAILVEAEETQTGIDVDREMETLLLIEQAYAANARVFQVAGDMIRVLMEL